MVLLEQPLKAAGLLRLSCQHNLDLLQDRLTGVRKRLGGQRFLFHAPDCRKSEGECPAKSALALLFLLPVTFIHTRWARGPVVPIGPQRKTRMGENPH